MTTLEADAPPRPRQHELTDRAIETVTARIVPLIEDALARVADRFLTDVVADGEPIDSSDTKPIIGMWDEEIPMLASVMSQVYVGAANVAMRSAAAGRSITEGLRDSYMLSATNRLKDVGQDLWKDTARTLADGNLAGESYDQLRGRLKETFAAGGKELGDTRATRIARTEVQSAVNRGTLDGVKASPGAPRYKTWLATLGPRTREAHAEADGQTVPIDAQFEVDGELLDYPGDPMGSGGNIINCRCTLIYGDDPGDGVPDVNRQMLDVDYCGGGGEQSLAAADFEAGEEIQDYIDPADADEAAWCAMIDDPMLQDVGGGMSFLDDPDASDEWVNANYAEWREGLSGSETAYIKQYTEDGFTDINGVLRRSANEAVDLEVHEGTINALDGALGRTSTPDDITVFRQLTDYSGDGFWGQLKAGDEFIDHAYVSTSLSNADAFGMTGSRVATNVRISIPRGSQGMPLARVGGKVGDDLALALREDEFLLPRGIKFRVKNVAADGSLDLEVV